MRVVVDTNILISALIRRDSIPDLIVAAWLEGRFDLLSHARQLDEFRRVSRRPELRGRFRPAQAGRLMNEIRQTAEILEGLPHILRSADATDDFLLALCEAGQADYLVTGDKAGLLALKNHGRTAIITAREFLSLLTQP